MTPPDIKEAATGIITLLFTDLVGSTEQSQRLGDDASEVLRREHFALLRDAIASHRGEEVKNMGDGLMVAFSSPSDAVGCAVAMQQAIDRHNKRRADKLGLRVGLNVGEVTSEEGDYFGSAVVVAERLCKQADGGQILVADGMRHVVGSRGGHGFNPVGELALKGIEEKVPASEVSWERAGDERMPFPPVLDQARPTPFVGRDPQFAKLREALARSREGVRQMMLIAGEPGIGKTRLATELARSAHADGALVLYGRCDEESLIPYQPFVEALRFFVAHSPVEELRDHLGETAAELARLVPGLRDRMPGLPVLERSDAESERYVFFEAVGVLLEAASQEAPVVLLLDDLHWADKPTLLLLRNLLRSTEPAALLILGTYRETELDRTHPLSDVLSDLRRERLAERIALDGLDEPAVEALLVALAGHEVPEDFAHAVLTETEGNPFFVEEVLLHLVQSQGIVQRNGRWVVDRPIDQLGIPEGVKEVIGRRLTRLSDDCNRVLGIASVIGRDFGLDLLEALADDLSTDKIIDVMDEAIAALVVTEVTGTAGRYTFVHALMRETLYDELTTTRRVRLHLRIAAAIEEANADDLDPHLAQVAHHLLEAAQASDVERAIDYARRAAERAIQLLAFEEGARLYERALQAIELSESTDDTLHTELLIALGDAQWKAGDARASGTTFLSAVEVARKTGVADLFARAALGLAGPPEVAIIPPDQTVEVLREALASLPESDSILRALALAALAVGLNQGQAHRMTHAQEAVEMAQRIGDGQTLVIALRAATIASSHPDRIREELEKTDEIIELSQRLGDRELEYYGHGWHLIHSFHLGNIADVDRDIELLIAGEQELRQRFFTFYTTMWRATRLMLDGRLEESEALSTAGLEIGQQGGLNIALIVFGAQITVLRWLQGRLSELEPMIRGIIQQTPGVPAFRATLALSLSEMEAEADAREVFESLAIDDFGTLPVDFTFLTAMLRLSDVAAFLKDVDRSEVIYRLLAPYHDFNAVAGGAISTSGSVSRALGVLCTTMSRWDDAERHFDFAVKHNEDMGATPFVAMTKRDHAAMLIARGDPNDKERARSLLEQAIATSADLGLARVLETSERLLGSL